MRSRLARLNPDLIGLALLAQARRAQSLNARFIGSVSEDSKRFTDSITLVRFLPLDPASTPLEVLGPENECLVELLMLRGSVVRWPFSNYFGSGHLALAELKGWPMSWVIAGVE